MRTTTAGVVSFAGSNELNAERILLRRLLPWYAALVAGAWLLIVPVFVRLSAIGVITDIMRHAHLAQKFIESGNWFSYSLWYPLVYVGSFGAHSDFTLRLASIGLLSILVAVKAVLVFWISMQVLKSPPFAMMIAAALMVATPIADPWRPADIYLGQLSVNVWHNSTNNLAAPCAILAFYFAMKLLKTPSVKLAGIFTLFMMLSVLAKPNFALGFLPVLGITMLIVLWRSGTSLKTRITVIAIAFMPSTVVLIYQYLAVFGDDALVQTTLVFAPFEVWRAHSDNIPLSVFVSLCGPILVWLALPSKDKFSIPMVVAWTTLLLAVAQMALLGERTSDGRIAEDGNWFWGSFTALTIVFLISLIKFAAFLKVRDHSPERLVGIFIALIAVVAHVASGFYYVLSVGAGGYPSF